MRFLLAAIALLIATPAFAQVEDTQLWTQTNANIPLDKDTRLTLEGIARWSDRQDGLYQTEIGLLASRKLSPHVEIGFGYRHVGAHNGNTARDEERIRQHIVLTYGRFTGRFRLDERFHPAGPQVGVRIRPLARYNLPVGGKTSLFVSHESFILPNDTRWGQRAGYERMRNIVGVNLPIAKNIAADIGYLNQYRFGKGGARDQMDHALTVQFSLSLDGIFSFEHD